MAVAAKTTTVLRSLIALSKDGEWGYGEPRQDSVAMAVIRGTDFDSVRRGDLSSLPVRYIPRAIAERKSLRSGDIVLETAGGSKDRPTGRSLFVKPSVIARSGFPLTCASFARFIRTDPSKVDSCFVYWYLQHLYETERLLRYHTQHTGVARFQFTIFADNEPLSLPPLPTQRKIAAILSAYDDLIANNTRRIAILEQMAQALYREWFVHFRFPGHEHARMVDSPLGAIPQGWQVVRLGEVAGVNTETIRRGNEPEEISYVDISSVSTGQIEKIERMAFAQAPGRARRLVKNGDIIWSSVRPNRRSYSLIIRPLPDTVVSTGFAVITPDSMPYTYLYQALTTDDFVGYLTNHARGAAYPAVNTEDFERAQVILPAEDILTGFHAAAADLYNERQNLLQRTDLLRSTRDLLLPKLVSGEVDTSYL